MSRRHGKFEDDLDELVHLFGMDPDDQYGSVSEEGLWVGLVLNITKADMMRVAKDTDTEWRDVREDLNRQGVDFPIHAIVTENSDGFVGVHFYPTADKARQAFADFQKDEFSDNPSVRKIGNIVYSWFSAATFLNGKQSRKLANNTVVKHMDGMRDGPIGVYLHRTPVVTYSNAGHITLRSGGWRTVTTKQRINQLLPPGWSLSQSKFEWTVTTPAGEYDFRDGIVFDRDGKVVRSGVDEGYTGNPETIELPPNWHNMGRWALAGLGHYINDKGGLRRKLNESERRSVVALLSTACSCAYYVHDIGTELLLLLNVKKQPMTFGGHQDTIMLDMIATFVHNQMEWPRVRLLAGEAAYREQWGRLANVCSDAIEQA